MHQPSFRPRRSLPIIKHWGGAGPLRDASVRLVKSDDFQAFKPYISKMKAASIPTRQTPRILVINPDSTSTKVAVSTTGETVAVPAVIFQATIDHTTQGTSLSTQVVEQEDLRFEAILTTLSPMLQDNSIDLIMARGGPLKPLRGGVYRVDETMLSDLRNARYANHASNLGALLGKRLADQWQVPLYIADPVTVDEFESVARISGVPGIVRKCRSHALNLKATARRLAEQLEIAFDRSRFVGVHMGGGISVAAMKYGRIIDVNDALLGMGPFGPERAGALPLAGVLDLAFESGATKVELEKRLAGESGLKGYLGTANLPQVEERIQAGDEKAKTVYDAMVYQIAKEIGAMATVLKTCLDGIFLTGGMAHSEMLVTGIRKRVAGLADIHVFPGEMEMEALAAAGLRVLAGLETPCEYPVG